MDSLVYVVTAIELLLVIDISSINNPYLRGSYFHWREYQQVLQQKMVMFMWEY